MQVKEYLKAHQLHLRKYKRENQPSKVFKEPPVLITSPTLPYTHILLPHCMLHLPIQLCTDWCLLCLIIHTLLNPLPQSYSGVGSRITSDIGTDQPRDHQWEQHIPSASWTRDTGCIAKVFSSLPFSSHMHGYLSLSVTAEAELSDQHPARRPTAKDKVDSLVSLHSFKSGEVFAKKEWLFQPSLLELQCPLPYEGMWSNIMNSLKKQGNNCNLLPAEIRQEHTQPRKWLTWQL